MSRYASRKFILSTCLTITACLGLLLDKMSGGEFSACIITILGAFGAANVTEKVLPQKGTEEK